MKWACAKMVPFNSAQKCTLFATTEVKLFLEATTAEPAMDGRRLLLIRAAFVLWYVDEPSTRKLFRSMVAHSQDAQCLSCRWMNWMCLRKAKGSQVLQPPLPAHYRALLFWWPCGPTRIWCSWQCKGQLRDSIQASWALDEERDEGNHDDWQTCSKNIVVQAFTDESGLMESETDTNLVRDTKQVSNYRYLFFVTMTCGFRWGGAVLFSRSVPLVLDPPPTPSQTHPEVYWK